MALPVPSEGSTAPKSRLSSQEITGCSDHRRFEVELEFVQSLASPQYINWLAQNRYFEDPSFINYLQYLAYWKRPEYACYVMYALLKQGTKQNVPPNVHYSMRYPHCLFFLELLASKDFRNNMTRGTSKDLLHSQQLYFYQHYRKHRLESMQQ